MIWYCVHKSLNFSDNHQMPDESQLYHPEDAEQYMLQAADGQPSLVQVATKH